MSAQSALLAYALAYAARGWPVLACHHPTSNGRCSCGRSDCDNVGKHPRYHHDDLARGLHSATTDPHSIQRWWLRWPNANIAIATGPQAGLLVADSDRATLYRLPSTATVATARGLHAYFTHPDAVSTRSTRTGLLPHLDTRGIGGMVIASPSRHRSGHNYTWLTTRPLAPPPPWIVALLLAPPPQANREKMALLYVSSQSTHTDQITAHPINHKTAYGAAASPQS